MPNNVRNNKQAAHPATSIVTQQQQRHQQTTSSTGKDSSIPIPDMNLSDIIKSPEYGNPNIHMLALNQQSQPVYMPSQQNYLPPCSKRQPLRHHGSKVYTNLSPIFQLLQLNKFQNFRPPPTKFLKELKGLKTLNRKSI